MANAPVQAQSAVIAASGSVSTAVYIGYGELIAIQMDTAWTTAALGFQVSFDGVLFQGLWTAAGAEVTVASAAAVASQTIVLDSDLFTGGVWLKIVSGSNASQVTQSAARTLQVLVRKLAHNIP